MRAVLAVLVVLAVSAGAGAPAAFAQSRGIVPLPRLVAQTRQAKAATFVRRPGSRIASTGAFRAMRRYVVARYAGIRAQHSFRDETGRVVDCLPFGDQPSLRGVRGGLRVPPAPDIAPDGRPAGATGASFAPERNADAALHPGDRDRAGNIRFCDRGLVPVSRVTLAQLAHFPTLAQFHAKGDPGDRLDPGQGPTRPIPPADSSHYYARGIQHVANLGADAWLDVWSPTVSDHQMSLSQIWVVGPDDASKQTVEAGWQVYPDKWGSDRAALFIYYTTANYKKGSGCYNVECKGFVQVANNIYLGHGFDHYSSPGADTQWGFELQFKRAPRTGDWWLFYRGPGDWIPVGYYPRSLFGTGQLATNATKIGYGGEDTGAPSALQMGSGAFAADGFGRAAYQHTAFYIDRAGTSQWATLTKGVTDTTCYTADIGAAAKPWGVFLFFGGPRCR